MQGSWTHAISVPTKTYHCGHEGCDQEVTSESGWPFLMNDQYEIWFIYICPVCLRPTFFDHYLNQMPPVHSTLS